MPRIRATNPPIVQTAPIAKKKSIFTTRVSASDDGVEDSGAGVVQANKPEATNAKQAMPTAIRNKPIIFISLERLSAATDCLRARSDFKVDG